MGGMQSLSLAVGSDIKYLRVVSYSPAVLLSSKSVTDLRTVSGPVKCRDAVQSAIFRQVSVGYRRMGLKLLDRVIYNLFLCLFSSVTFV